MYLIIFITRISVLLDVYEALNKLDFFKLYTSYKMYKGFFPVDHRWTKITFKYTSFSTVFRTDEMLFRFEFWNVWTSFKRPATLKMNVKDFLKFLIRAFLFWKIKLCSWKVQYDKGRIQQFSCYKHFLFFFFCWWWGRYYLTPLVVNIF